MDHLHHRALIEQEHRVSIAFTSEISTYLGIFMGAAQGFPYAVESVHAHNNLIANTVRLEPGAVPEVPDSAFKATAFTETLDTTFERNIITGSTEITYTDQLGASGVLPGIANNASMWIYVFNSGSMTANENLNVRDNIIISMDEAVQASPISGGGAIESNCFFNTPVDTGSNHGTYYPNAADAHMADFTFVTDRFTNNPRTITIAGVRPTVDTPNGEGIGVGAGE